jgi:lysozyme
MSTMLPRARPKISRAEVEAHLQRLKVDLAKYPFIAFGFRGYYRDTMGRPKVNDHAIYDDAIGLITDRAFLVCNGNTDPSAHEGTVTGRAKLEPGIWPMWCLDLHKGQYRAFCQRMAECVVFRTGTAGYKPGATHAKYGLCLGEGRWKGMFGINGHRGGVNTTSSEGCQTVPEPQWTELIELAEREARRLWGAAWKERCILYALIDLTA